MRPRIEVHEGLDLDEEKRNWLIRAKTALNHRYRLVHMIQRQRERLRNPASAEAVVEAIKAREARAARNLEQNHLQAKVAAEKRARMEAEARAREKIFVDVMRERLPREEFLSAWEETRRREQER